MPRGVLQKVKTRIQRARQRHKVDELEFFVVYVMNRLHKVDELVKVQYDKHQALTEIVARQGHRTSGGGPADTGSNQLNASMSSNASAIFARLKVRTFAK